MTTLDLIVLESAVDSRPLTVEGFTRLMDAAIGSDPPPVPIAPTALFTPEFKVVTYTQRVRALILEAERQKLVFAGGHGISSYGVFRLFPKGRWADMAVHLSADHAGLWLLWGLNWMVIDVEEVNPLLRSNPVMMNAFAERSRQEVVRHLDAIHNM